MKRTIITIDDDRCTGCGLCIPNCPEGALQIIDGKARLVSDLFCDGLGACIGHCHEGAITTEEREAEAYDETKVMENIVRQGANVVSAHLRHLKDHCEDELFREALAYLVEHDLEIPAEHIEESCRCGELARAGGGARGIVGSSSASGGCPGSAAASFENHGAAGCPGSRVAKIGEDSACGEKALPQSRPSRLRQWPVQIMLVPPHAPFFAGADLLIAADCVPFTFADFHDRLLAGRVLLVGCPKLDDAAHYLEKLAEIFRRNDIRSITVAHMEVPCCFGMVKLVQSAIERSGKKIPFAARMFSIKGDEL